MSETCRCICCCCCFFFQAEDGIRDVRTWLEFRRVLFRSLRYTHPQPCIGYSFIISSLVYRFRVDFPAKVLSGVRESTVDPRTKVFSRIKVAKPEMTESFDLQAITRWWVHDEMILMFHSFYCRNRWTAWLDICYSESLLRKKSFHHLVDAQYKLQT